MLSSENAMIPDTNMQLESRVVMTLSAIAFPVEYKTKTETI